ncbi:hypothetical protein Pcinc_034111 [Petrolisthes cinctipes]|uniref:Uncharacterized protein n=1 Tax=Petrolisthes cinctipes TaxID=88211 RepID=A0AAE1EQY9_PETCI|nr:hypothetical protein Pcinc_034111 [Petrolisthes cinctipes]
MFLNTAIVAICECQRDYKTCGECYSNDQPTQPIHYYNLGQQHPPAPTTDVNSTPRPPPPTTPSHPHSRHYSHDSSRHTAATTAMTPAATQPPSRHHPQ